VTARFGILRSLMVCGCCNRREIYLRAASRRRPQAALSRAVRDGRKRDRRDGRHGAGGLSSSLCSPAFTATQYALLSSLAVVGRTMVASSSGVLAERVGWVHFFLLTTVVTLPALLLLVWIERQEAAHPGQPSSPPR